MGTQTRKVVDFSSQMKRRYRAKNKLMYVHLAISFRNTVSLFGSFRMVADSVLSRAIFTEKPIDSSNVMPSLPPFVLVNTENRDREGEGNPLFWPNSDSSDDEERALFSMPGEDGEGGISVCHLFNSRLDKLHSKKNIGVEETREELLQLLEEEDEKEIWQIADDSVILETLRRPHAFFIENRKKLHLLREEHTRKDSTARAVVNVNRVIPCNRAIPQFDLDHVLQRTPLGKAIAKAAMIAPLLGFEHINQDDLQVIEEFCNFCIPCDPSFVVEGDLALALPSGFQDVRHCASDGPYLYIAAPKGVIKLLLDETHAFVLHHLELPNISGILVVSGNVLAKVDREWVKLDSQSLQPIADLDCPQSFSNAQCWTAAQNVVLAWHKDGVVYRFLLNDSGCFVPLDSITLHLPATADPHVCQLRGQEVVGMGALSHWHLTRLTQEFTLEFWAKLEDLTTRSVLFEFGDLVVQLVDFIATVSVHDQQAILILPSKCQGTWFHIAIVRQVQEGKGRMLLHLNGKLMNVAETSTAPIVGRVRLPKVNGTLAEMRLWRAARGPTELVHYMDAQLELDNDVLSQVLAGYWRFDEGKGSSFLDSSGNENHLCMWGIPEDISCLWECCSTFPVERGYTKYCLSLGRDPFVLATTFGFLVLTTIEGTTDERRSLQTFSSEGCLLTQKEWMFNGSLAYLATEGRILAIKPTSVSLFQRDHSIELREYIAFRQHFFAKENPRDRLLVALDRVLVSNLLLSEGKSVPARFPLRIPQQSVPVVIDFCFSAFALHESCEPRDKWRIALSLRLLRFIFVQLRHTSLTPDSVGFNLTSALSNPIPQGTSDRGGLLMLVLSALIDSPVSDELQNELHTEAVALFDVAVGLVFPTPQSRLAKFHQLITAPQMSPSQESMISPLLAQFESNVQVAILLEYLALHNELLHAMVDASEKFPAVQRVVKVLHKEMITRVLETPENDLFILYSNTLFTSTARFLRKIDPINSDTALRSWPLGKLVPSLVESWAISKSIRLIPVMRALLAELRCFTDTMDTSQGAETIRHAERTVSTDHPFVGGKFEAKLELRGARAIEVRLQPQSVVGAPEALLRVTGEDGTHTLGSPVSRALVAGSTVRVEYFCQKADAWGLGLICTAHRGLAWRWGSRLLESTLFAYCKLAARLLQSASRPDADWLGYWLGGKSFLAGGVTSGATADEDTLFDPDVQALWHRCREEHLLHLPRNIPDPVDSALQAIFAALLHHGTEAPQDDRGLSEESRIAVVARLTAQQWHTLCEHHQAHNGQLEAVRRRAQWVAQKLECAADATELLRSSSSALPLPNPHIHSGNTGPRRVLRGLQRCLGHTKERKDVITSEQGMREVLEFVMDSRVDIGILEGAMQEIRRCVNDRCLGLFLLIELLLPAPQSTLVASMLAAESTEILRVTEDLQATAGLRKLCVPPICDASKDPWVLQLAIWVTKAQHYHRGVTGAGALGENAIRKLFHTYLESAVAADVLPVEGSNKRAFSGDAVLYTIGLLNYPWRHYDFTLLTRLKVASRLAFAFSLTHAVNRQVPCAATVAQLKALILANAELHETGALQCVPENPPFTFVLASVESAHVSAGGPWYFETTFKWQSIPPEATLSLGITQKDGPKYPLEACPSVCVTSHGQLWANGTLVCEAESWQSGDVLGIGYGPAPAQQNGTGGALYFSRNGILLPASIPYREDGPLVLCVGLAGDTCISLDFGENWRCEFPSTAGGAERLRFADLAWSVFSKLCEGCLEELVRPGAGMAELMVQQNRQNLTTLRRTVQERNAEGVAFLFHLLDVLRDDFQATMKIGSEATALQHDAEAVAVERGSLHETDDPLDSGATPDLDVPQDAWSCQACTYFNSLWRTKCEICETPKPAEPAGAVPVQPPRAKDTSSQKGGSFLQKEREHWGLISERATRHCAHVCELLCEVFSHTSFCQVVDYEKLVDWLPALFTAALLGGTLAGKALDVISVLLPLIPPEAANGVVLKHGSSDAADSALALLSRLATPAVGAGAIPLSPAAIPALRALQKICFLPSWQNEFVTMATSTFSTISDQLAAVPAKLEDKDCINLQLSAVPTLFVVLGTLGGCALPLHAGAKCRIRRVRPGEPTHCYVLGITADSNECQCVLHDPIGGRRHQKAFKIATEKVEVVPEPPGSLVECSTVAEGLCNALRACVRAGSALSGRMQEAQESVALCRRHAKLARNQQGVDARRVTAMFPPLLWRKRLRRLALHLVAILSRLLRAASVLAAAWPAETLLLPLVETGLLRVLLSGQGPLCPFIRRGLTDHDIRQSELRLTYLYKLYATREKLKMDSRERSAAADKETRGGLTAMHEEQSEECESWDDASLFSADLEDNADYRARLENLSADSLLGLVTLRSEITPIEGETPSFTDGTRVEVELPSAGQISTGTVLWVGKCAVTKPSAAPSTGDWQDCVGLELDEPVGDTDGSTTGIFFDESGRQQLMATPEAFFKCRPSHGIFLLATAIRRVLYRQPCTSDPQQHYELHLEFDPEWLASDGRFVLRLLDANCQGQYTAPKYEVDGTQIRLTVTNPKPVSAIDLTFEAHPALQKSCTKVTCHVRQVACFSSEPRLVPPPAVPALTEAVEIGQKLEQGHTLGPTDHPSDALIGTLFEETHGASTQPQPTPAVEHRKEDGWRNFTTDLIGSECNITVDVGHLFHQREDEVLSESKPVTPGKDFWERGMRALVPPVSVCRKMQSASFKEGGMKIYCGKVGTVNKVDRSDNTAQLIFEDKATWWYDLAVLLLPPKEVSGQRPGKSYPWTEGMRVLVPAAEELSRRMKRCGFQTAMRQYCGTVGTVKKVDRDDDTAEVRFSDGTEWWYDLEALYLPGGGAVAQGVTKRVLAGSYTPWKAGMVATVAPNPLLRSLAREFWTPTMFQLAGRSGEILCVDTADFTARLRFPPSQECWLPTACLLERLCPSNDAESPASGTWKPPAGWDGWTQGLRVYIPEESICRQMTGPSYVERMRAYCSREAEIIDVSSDRLKAQFDDGETWWYGKDIVCIARRPGSVYWRVGMQARYPFTQPDPGSPTRYNGNTRYCGHVGTITQRRERPPIAVIRFPDLKLMECDPSQLLLPTTLQPPNPEASYSVGEKVQFSLTEFPQPVQGEVLHSENGNVVVRYLSPDTAQPVEITIACDSLAPAPVIVAELDPSETVRIIPVWNTRCCHKASACSPRRYFVEPEEERDMACITKHGRTRVGALPPVGGEPWTVGSVEPEIDTGKSGMRAIRHYIWALEASLSTAFVLRLFYSSLTSGDAVGLRGFENCLPLKHADQRLLLHVALFDLRDNQGDAKIVPLLLRSPSMRAELEARMVEEAVQLLYQPFGTTLPVSGTVPALQDGVRDEKVHVFGVARYSVLVPASNSGLTFEFHDNTQVEPPIRLNSGSVDVVVQILAPLGFVARVFGQPGASYSLLVTAIEWYDQELLSLGVDYLRAILRSSRADTKSRSAVFAPEVIGALGFLCYSSIGSQRVHALRLLHSLLEAWPTPPHPAPPLAHLTALLWWISSQQQAERREAWPMHSAVVQSGIQVVGEVLRLHLLHGVSYAPSRSLRPVPLTPLRACERLASALADHPSGVPSIMLQSVDDIHFFTGSRSANAVYDGTQWNLNFTPGQLPLPLFLRNDFVLGTPPLEDGLHIFQVAFTHPTTTPTVKVRLQREGGKLILSWGSDGVLLLHEELAEQCATPGKVNTWTWNNGDRLLIAVDSTRVPQQAHLVASSGASFSFEYPKHPGGRIEICIFAETKDTSAEVKYLPSMWSDAFVTPDRWHSVVGTVAVPPRGFGFQVDTAPAQGSVLKVGWGTVTDDPCLLGQRVAFVVDPKDSGFEVDGTVVVVLSGAYVRTFHRGRLLQEQRIVEYQQHAALWVPFVECQSPISLDAVVKERLSDLVRRELPQDTVGYDKATFGTDLCVLAESFQGTGEGLQTKVAFPLLAQLSGFLFRWKFQNKDKDLWSLAALDAPPEEARERTPTIAALWADRCGSAAQQASSPGPPPGIRQLLRLLRLVDALCAPVARLVDVTAAGSYSAAYHQLKPLLVPDWSGERSRLMEQVLAKDKERNPPCDKKPEIVINRPRAHRHRQQPQRHPDGSPTVFNQVFEGLRTSTLSRLFRKACSDRQSQFFAVNFKGEGAQDWGGPFRETFVEMAVELMSDALPLFLPAPNQASDDGLGLGRDFWVPNPAATSPLQLAQFEFLGALMGGTFRTSESLTLSVPPFFWKHLARQPCHEEDLLSFDHLAARSLERVLRIEQEGVTPEQFEEADYRFVTWLSDGTETELVPGGKERRVGFGEREHFVGLVRDARLKESQRQMDAIRKGLTSVVPEVLLDLLTWQELEVRICGEPVVSLPALLASTTYEDGMSADHPTAKLFWEVCAQLTDRDRSQLLKFTCGRSRLPCKFILRPYKTSGNPDAYLPVAHTCFYQLDVPAYSTADVLRRKLVYAIYNCQSISDKAATDWESDEEGAG
eukprot:TRINITY_DN16038_c0_g1_i1.p1 TRINITY_DN16038_c0_g1~~TRINITY_DN16038_c0_g1_i1.p1  ORF type:complete len:4478 (+),score=532.68 TRINITY_DN16038_c0_g1_i1:861-14294(+)